MRMREGVLARILWPAGVIAQIGVAAAIGWWRPDLVGRAMGLTAVAMLVALVGIEQALPYRREWSVRGDPDLPRDLSHAVLYTVIGGAVAQVVFVDGLASGLSHLDFAGGLAVWPGTSPMVAQVLLVVVLGDLLEYWYHRLAHTVAWLWSLHAVHHMPVRLHAIKGPRHHVFYYLGRGVCVWTPLVLIGVPPALVTWQFVAVVLAGTLAHANVGFRIPAVMHRILVTPDFHRLHHAADARLGHSNYATVFPIWDVLFGTRTDPLVTEVRQLGIAGDPIPHRLVNELLSPLTLISVSERR
jgi:sterol desaturase/sphingolipid hydroxylase (fatty acid hydroxylase superfamily)